MQDLVTVVAFLRHTYGYKVDMIVGHSRGSVVGMHWLCTSEEGKHVSTMVNVSGRYRMHVSALSTLEPDEHSQNLVSESSVGLLARLSPNRSNFDTVKIECPSIKSNLIPKDITNGN